MHSFFCSLCVSGLHGHVVVWSCIHGCLTCKDALLVGVPGCFSSGFCLFITFVVYLFFFIKYWVITESLPRCVCGARLSLFLWLFSFCREISLMIHLVCVRTCMCVNPFSQLNLLLLNKRVLLFISWKKKEHLWWRISESRCQQFIRSFLLLISVSHGQRFHLATQYIDYLFIF